MLQLYKNIKSFRKQNNWSQDELAKKMGYTDRSTISRIESGEVDLPQSKIMEFARIFDVAPGDLMGWDEPEYDSREVEKAIDLYRRFTNLPPEKQEALRILLEVPRTDA